MDISQKTKHPETLGSSYTNPSITTDFAESLIEDCYANLYKRR